MERSTGISAIAGVGLGDLEILADPLGEVVHLLEHAALVQVEDEHADDEDHENVCDGHELFESSSGVFFKRRTLERPGSNRF